MRTTHWKRKWKDDPLVYGEIFDWIQAEAKAGRLCALRGKVNAETGEAHRCEDIWRATGHHTPTIGSRRGNDLRCVGLCGLADDMAHSRRWGWTEGRIHEAFGVNLQEAGREHSEMAIEAIWGFGDRPDWLEDAEVPVPRR